MEQSIVMDVAQRAITVAIMISAPILGLGLIVGLLISIIQATTQIQEPTLSFIPKLITIFITLIIFGPWMGNMITEFTISLFENIHTFIR
ncbi:flagellar biosynthesis protein FliQ [Lutispora saccharofermentans]|uniref:Flagellar biosynthetic protein FliQ n=1 Tax=Lutispora saccharofermentans TaxID=3024236 RepID=A0ABT1N9Q3_9FIRM|nr:flagellar biosynthesis protein FliQ [Lutispora saccharofermentans]MCQ1527985.1 flagellar biosynthesis protein FliQ [Lutispora saccharofermentans]